MPAAKAAAAAAQPPYIGDLLDAATISVGADGKGCEIQLPPWYDEAKFKRGQQFIKANLPGVITAGFCGFIAVLAIPSILEVLMFTRRSSTPMTAYKRYVQTNLHTLNWYTCELKPGSRSWKSLQYARRMHAVTDKQVQAKNSRMMISQKDMALTQFSFAGFVVLCYKKLGIQYDREGMEGFVHIWRTLGYMLGIQDRYNICTADMATSERRMTLVLEQIVRPALQSTSAEFAQMANAMVDGMWCISTFIEYNAFMFLTRRLARVPGHYYWDDDERDGTLPVYKQLGWHSRVILNMILTLNEVLLNYTLLKWFFTVVFLVNTYLIDRYFPYLAMIKFGIKNAYVKMVY